VTHPPVYCSVGASMKAAQGLALAGTLTLANAVRRGLENPRATEEQPPPDGANIIPGPAGPSPGQ
jgi:hypothetical protein